jgi:mevalonate kinase
MPAFSATAPGKTILFGEHAVVYGRPAIAAPVDQVRAKVYITPNPVGKPGCLKIDAPDIALKCDLDALPNTNPIRSVIEKVGAEFNITHFPSAYIRIKSTIPIASGLGSGAAISVSLIRALASFLGREIPNQRISALAYEVEKIHHGTPSGIDNTVITYAQPIYYCKDPAVLEKRNYDLLIVSSPILLVVADSGIASPTAQAVAGVRHRWQAAPLLYEEIFGNIHQIVDSARRIIETGKTRELGPLMNENQAQLKAIEVSNPQLDHLIHAALNAGAGGAKLSGAGGGGNLIGLANPDTAPGISQALLDAGAINTIISTIQPTNQERIP